MKFPQYNWIGGKHPLDEKLCAVSLILSKNEDHAYIVIESLNAQEEITAFEAHLGTIDHKRAIIDTAETNLSRLLNIAQHNKSRTWNIYREEMEQLKKDIDDDKIHYEQNPMPYVKSGMSSTSGFFGYLLEDIGSEGLKHASVEKNHSLLESKIDSLQEYKSLQKSVKTTVAASHDSIDSTLRKGHNCASWAKEKVKTILGNQYRETSWEKMSACIIVDPKQVVTPSTCLIL